VRWRSFLFVLDAMTPQPGDLADDGPMAMLDDTFNDRLVLYRGLRDGSLLRNQGSKGAAPCQLQRP
jgi:hypothetical protein